MDKEKTNIFWDEVRELQSETEIEFLDSIRVYERPEAGLYFLLGVPDEIQKQVQEIYEAINK